MTGQRPRHVVRNATDENTQDNPRLAYRDARVTVFHGDCLEVLPSLPDRSAHAVVSDPPYGVGFMGRQWDRPWANAPTGFAGRGHLRLPRYGARSAAAAYQQWCEQWAKECLRLLRPGGHLVVFGGTRTWHRLASAIEDAGFEIRDSIAWLYGTGFPKSLDVAKELDRLAHAERQVVKRGPSMKRARSGAAQRRTGSWIKNDGRLYVPAETLPVTDAVRQWQGWGTNLKPAFEPIIVARKPLAGTVAATVREYGTGALHIDACRVPLDDADRAKIDAEHAGMDAATYRRRPGASLNLSVRPLPLKPAHAHDLGRWPANVALTHAAGCGEQCAVGCPAGDLNRQSAGASARYMSSARGAARYFPVFRWQAKASRSERPYVGTHAHPTVKPLELVRWLVRLVTPSDGLVLDPFLGSGTTAEAARLEGFRCIGIERETEYLPLIRARLAGHGG